MFVLVFVFLLLIVVNLTLLCIIYEFKQLRQIEFITKIAKNKKHLTLFLTLIPIIAICISAFFIGVVSAIIILFHLTVFTLLCNLITCIVKKLSKKVISKTITGITAITLTVVYMGIGWHLAHQVYETYYSFETNKHLPKNSIRIVQIADSHLGVTLDGKCFSQQIERIQKINPDIVVITGDFVDDDSNKKDMIQACKSLGSLKTTYGVYFTFGNHDKGYFKNSHDFSKINLIKELEKNNVKILEDETVLIDDKLYIIGRQDKSEKKRSDINTIVQELDKSKYMIVLDHQPNDYKNEAEAEVDLVLSGHTHGGHIFPAGLIGLISGANDKVYGTEKNNNTDFVVTSGISGWEIPFKTGAISEYVVIDISNTK